MRINVKKYIEQEKEELREALSKGKSKTLLILQHGDDSASNSYIKGKIKDCEEVGINTVLYKWNGLETMKVRAFIETLNEHFDGIILQEPCGLKYDQRDSILGAICSSQDVDGLLPRSNHQPCTPQGIIRFLEEYLRQRTEGQEAWLNPFKGKVVAVVGKGELVGKPLVPMLMEKGATVLSCNSKTPDLAAMTKLADIVISATGIPGLITRDMLKDGAIIMDAGISFVDGKLHGDCDKSLYDEENIYTTTVPGGVGLLTRLELMKNVAAT